MLLKNGLFSFFWLSSVLLFTPCTVQATEIVSSNISFSNLQINPASGTLVLSSPWQLESFSQANNSLGEIVQSYDFSLVGGTLATATPSANWASAQSGAVATGSPPDLNVTGSASSNIQLPSTSSSWASTTANSTLYNEFTITGGTGSVAVNFSALLDGAYHLSTDQLGTAQTQLVLSFQILNILSNSQDSQILSYQNSFSIGPNESLNGVISQTLSATRILDMNTTYSVLFYIDADGPFTSVPEPSTSALLLLALIMFTGFSWYRHKAPLMKTTRFIANGNKGLVLFFLTLLCLAGFFTKTVSAQPTGGNPPPPFIKDPPCSCNQKKKELSGNKQLNGGISSINALGILYETTPLFNLGNNSVSSLNLSLTYKSDNADSSHALLDIGLGYGWTHSYSTLLFSQFGSMYRLDGEGNVTKYQLGANSTYKATTGYFETLVKNLDGSFTLRQKDGTVYRFAKQSGDTLLINGPVWRMQSITDRNNNITTLTYSTGRLTTITGAEGRSLQLTYDAGGHLATVKDPLNHVVQLSYNTQRQLLSVTDANNQALRYSYNTLNQMSSMLDKNDHKTTFLYANGKPIGGVDGNGAAIVSSSNPLNWQTNANALAFSQMREYIPSTTTQTDGRGNNWQYQYDLHGYVTKSIAPDGAQTLYSYDPATLQIASQTDANAHQTLYEYDAQGDMTKQTDALGHITLYQYESTFNNVTQITYPNGSITQYQYDANGNRTQEIRDVGGLNLQTNWTYYAPSVTGNASAVAGLLKTQEIHNGAVTQITRYEYDNRANQIKVIDPENNATQYSYDTVGNRLNTTDANGHITSYAYDSLYRLIQETDPLGYQTLYSYDANGNRIAMQKQVTQSPDSYELTQYQYDVRDRMSQEVRDPSGLNLSTQYAYDNNNNRIQMTDPRGKNTVYSYDVQNRLTQVQDALSHIAQTRYDSVGNRVCSIDANQHYSFVDYDALNRPTKQSQKIGIQECSTGDSDDIITASFYDTGSAIACSPDSGAPTCNAPMPGSRQIAYSIDPEGKRSYFKYDKVNRPWLSIHKVTDTSDSCDSNDKCEYTLYDAASNRIAQIDANGNRNASTYFANNWLHTTANALSETTSYTYDAVGQVKTVQSPGGNTSTNTYNNRNELVQIDDLIGRVASTSYDGIGNRIQQCDGNNNCASYAYDAVNRLLSVTDALAASSHYSYDNNGNLLQTTDRANNGSCNVYDDINRRTLSVQRLVGTDCATLNANDLWTTTQYDDVGNVLTLTTAKHGSTPSQCNGASPPADCETTRYAYDAVNRKIQETYPDAGVRQFVYDNASNLLQRIDQQNRATDYVYNDLYYLTARNYQLDPSDSFTYDVGGRMLTANRDGWTDSFDYDAANRLLQSNQNGQPVTYAYDIANRKRTLSYPGGKTVVEQRDLRERLDNLNSGTIAQYSYDLGNRVSTRVYGNGTRASYSYNANNWITDLVHTKADSSLIAGFSHDYDVEGNKRYEEKQHDPTHSEGYHYDNLYRLIDFKVGNLDFVSSSVLIPLTQTQYQLDKLGNWDSNDKDGAVQTRLHNAVNEITQINAQTLSYDDNGNLTQASPYSYLYDQENRLTQISSGVETVSNYRYDALSRRVAKITGVNRGNSETRYVYDDARIIEEQSNTGVTLAAYTYGNYIDEVLSMDRGGATDYYHQNALWSVEAITDSAAAVVERVAYDAYGTASITNGAGVSVSANIWGAPHSAVGNSWLFTGRQLDEEAGLYFYRARYYDSGKGRFLQRDPLGYVDGMNLFQYVNGNPFKYVDPNGLETEEECLKRIEDEKNKCQSAAQKEYKSGVEALLSEIDRLNAWMKAAAEAAVLGMPVPNPLSAAVAGGAALSNPTGVVDGVIADGTLSLIRAADIAANFSEYKKEVNTRKYQYYDALHAAERKYNTSVNSCMTDYYVHLKQCTQPCPKQNPKILSLSTGTVFRTIGSVSLGSNEETIVTIQSE